MDISVPLYPILVESAGVAPDSYRVLGGSPVILPSSMAAFKGNIEAT